MTIYIGKIKDGRKHVTAFDPLTGEEKLLPLRLDLRMHSPDGYEWGYHGSGPAQLALAILAYELGDAAALNAYQDFKRAVIAGMSMNTGFVISSAHVRSVMEAMEEGE